ncbi:MAG TPA: hypothetical protein VMW27_12235 [Thermoanaerobaculia bacterium]|nr:hypothetical protein [Thermoanaerobaculia bacterium]
MLRRLVLFLCAGSLSLAWDAHAATCSCTAPDRSCSASITCSGGCSAVCGNRGVCSSSCSGGGGLEPYVDSLTASPDFGETADKRNSLVSLDIEEATAQDVSATLTELAGKSVVWVPQQSDSTVSMQVKDFPLDALLTGLAKRGAVAVGGRAQEKRPASSRNPDLSRTVTIQALGADATLLSNLLGELLQGTVELRPRDSGLNVDLDVKEMPVGAVVRQLSRFGEITLNGEPLPR